MSDAELTADEREREERRRQRRSWPIRRYPLGEEPPDDLLDVTTASERFAMVWQLTVRAWRLAGRDIPTYERSEAPGRLIKADDLGLPK